jgi:hypothetical protein
VCLPTIGASAAALIRTTRPTRTLAPATRSRLEIGDRNVGEEAASLCSGATVTVRTPNIALLNFFKYSLERVGTRQHPLDIHELLSAYVVEVQHDWIGLAAVNTRVLREITVNRPGSEVSVVALVFLT